MPVNKVAQRRGAKIASIVEVAWSLARENGIQLVSLHALAKEVGMRQPSLYGYFDSKNTLYDAMFADGNRQLLKVLSAIDLPADPRVTLKAYLGPVIQRHAQFRVPCVGITLLGSRCWTHAVVPLAVEVVPGDVLVFQVSHLAVSYTHLTLP